MKKYIRNQILDTRNNLSKEFVVNSSEIITDKILNLDIVKNSQIVMLYLDFKNEVIMDNLVDKLIELDKTVCTPKTIFKDKKLVPKEIIDLDNNIDISTFGIREPNALSNEIDIDSIDIVIVPGVAFDVNCFRIGYGAGLYDRFLSNLRNDAKTIGVCFDFQVLDEVPREEHDKQLNMVITELRTINTNTKSQF